MTEKMVVPTLGSLETGAEKGVSMVAPRVRPNGKPGV